MFEKEVKEFLESITNMGSLGTLIRVPKEWLIQWACSKVTDEYERGYKDGHTAASLAAISELANAGD